MRRVITCCCLGLAILAFAPARGRADYVITPYGFIIEGEVKTNPGKTVTVKPYGSEACFFKLDDVRILKDKSPEKLFRREFGRARKEGAEGYMKAGQWALQHGMLDKFYLSVEEALKVDPKHERAKVLLERRKNIGDEAPESEKAIADLKQRLNRPMSMKRSAHFNLFYDTSDERATRRLKLLEQVYESFLMFFWSRGIDLPRPAERMRVVLFGKHEDFLAFGKALDPSLVSAAGFWDPKMNVSVFFDYGTEERFKRLVAASEKFSREAADAVKRRLLGAGELRQFASSLRVLVDVARESVDIEVVSHECTHQMAGNTNLFPPEVNVPSWVHEGLATFFEAPDDARWSGIGAVNEERLEWYRALSKDTEHSNIDFVVGDEIFDRAATHASVLHAYGQAWALTHFLINNHFEQLMKYYRLVSELPPDMIFPPSVLRECFDEAFGTERNSLDANWRSHMSGLKTDFEILMGE